MKRKDTGDLGEKLASSFLQKRGYRILERNYRCRAGEIDLVARQGESLVFVEVRTKMGPDFGSPEESLSSGKVQHLQAAAEFYLQSHPESPETWRIDFVAVELDRENRVTRIELFENAVEC